MILPARVEELAREAAQEYNGAWRQKADLPMLRLLLVLLLVLVAISVIFLVVTLGGGAHPPAVVRSQAPQPGPQIIELAENRDGPAKLLAVYRTHDLKSWPDYAPAEDVHFDVPPLPEKVQQATPMSAIGKAK